MLAALGLLLRALLARYGAEILYRELNSWLEKHDLTPQGKILSSQEQPVRIVPVAAAAAGAGERDLTAMDFEDEGYIWDTREICYADD